ncbi:hypothetical protein [Rhizobium leguminosarum]|uniref:hypothetical protein n=1 Tax=Rhizobium TaxID=379 RepID=UPI00140FFC8E|nr:hypothetical protein [Rhizobium leguminosarum]QIO66537.1 hypothetical protein HA462_16345 [Rhizobium leguminosarum bv. trifolii]
MFYRHDDEVGGDDSYWIVSSRRAQRSFDWLEHTQVISDRSLASIWLDRPVREMAPADISWATKALELQEKPSHAELVGVVSGIAKLIAERNTPVLSATLFDLLKDPRLRLEVMVAALRGSFPARSQIKNWKELIALAHQRVLKSGRNADSLLSGLG